LANSMGDSGPTGLVVSYCISWFSLEKSIVPTYS
jgi:hypothetical protein